MKAENNLVKENGIIPKETNNKLLIIIIGLFLLIIWCLYLLVLL